MFRMSYLKSPLYNLHVLAVLFGYLHVRVPLNIFLVDFK